MGGVDALSAVVQTPQRPIVIVGLNAALQKRFVLETGKNLEPGNVHRAAHCETGVGGKGQDVGVSLSCLMKAARQQAKDDDGVVDGRVLLAQFLGQGPEGDSVASTLASHHRLSDALTVRTVAPLRTATTIVGAGGEATELVEPSGVVTVEEMEELRAKIGALGMGGGGDGATKGTGAGAVCIMGSMPPGCEGGTYADLTDRLADESSLVLIDSVIGLDHLISVLKEKSTRRQKGGKGGGAVLKVNAAELCNLAGLTKSGGKEADQASVDEIAASAKGFVAKYGGSDAIEALDYLCVTDGKHPAYLVQLLTDDADRSFPTWRMPTVDLSQRTGDAGTLFPIGAGDTVAAGTLAAWQYLHNHRDGNADGVVSDEVGKIIDDVRAKWTMTASAGKNEEERGLEMAAAFAFGLSCASASCLQQENSVFEVEDALEFFGGMGTPVLL